MICTMQYCCCLVLDISGQIVLLLDPTGALCKIICYYTPLVQVPLVPKPMHMWLQNANPSTLAMHATKATAKTPQLSKQLFLVSERTHVLEVLVACIAGQILRCFPTMICHHTDFLDSIAISLFVDFSFVSLTNTEMTVWWCFLTKCNK